MDRRTRGVDIILDTAKTWKKNITIFLLSQTVSLFGSSIVQFAIMWHITLETQSGVMMTISIICGFLPTLFLSPFAGVWADRYNRKLLIMLSDSMIALVTLMLTFLFFIGYDALWLLFVASALRAFGSGIQSPAIGAILPQLVPENRLTKVNGINSSIQSLVMLVSPMISGALLSVTSLKMIFFIDVITAIIAVMILLILKVPTHAKALDNQSISYFQDMQKGIVYIKNHTFIKRLFLLLAIYYFLVTPVAFLTPLQVTRSFGDDVWRLTAIESSFSAGVMLGGLLIASWGGFKNRVHTIAFAGLFIGIFTVALGIVPVFWIYVLFVALFGLFMPSFGTLFTVVLQEKVEEGFLGRVFGVLGMISSSMMPLGMLIFGPMADLFKIEWLLIGTGIFIIAESIFMVKDKILFEAGKPLLSSGGN